MPVILTTGLLLGFDTDALPWPDARVRPGEALAPVDVSSACVGGGMRELPVLCPLCLCLLAGTGGWECDSTLTVDTPFALFMEPFALLKPYGL